MHLAQKRSSFAELIKPVVDLFIVVCIHCSLRLSVEFTILGNLRLVENELLRKLTESQNPAKQKSLLLMPHLPADRLLHKISYA
jgi:hypothetical protein